MHQTQHQFSNLFDLLLIHEAEPVDSPPLPTFLLCFFEVTEYYAKQGRRKATYVL